MTGGGWPEPPNYYEAPKVGTKVVLQNPAYPVIYPEPTFGQAFANMRPSMWALAGGMALAGAAAGYWKGSKIHWQKPAMYFGMLFLGKTGMAWGLTDSTHRLMGLKENDREMQSLLPGLLQRREAY